MVIINHTILQSDINEDSDKLRDHLDSLDAMLLETGQLVESDIEMSPKGVKSDNSTYHVGNCTVLTHYKSAGVSTLRAHVEIFSNPYEFRRELVNTVLSYVPELKVISDSRISE